MFKNYCSWVFYSHFAFIQCLLLVQEKKEHRKMIPKNDVDIFLYANEKIWWLGTAGPPSYVQAQLFVSMYVKFCFSAIRTFGVREWTISLQNVLKFRSPFLFMQMRKFGGLKLLCPPPMFKNCCLWAFCFEICKHAMFTFGAIQPRTFVNKNSKFDRHFCLCKWGYMGA